MAPEDKHDASLEEGLLTVATGEKRTFAYHTAAAGRLTSSTPTASKDSAPKMRFARLAFVFLAAFLITFGLASTIATRGRPCSRGHADVAAAGSEVALTGSHLDGPAHEDLLHRLLHAYFPDKYRHGVYSSDREALESLHQEDAIAASVLSQLAKRQDPSLGPNGTTTPSSTAGPPPDDSTTTTASPSDPPSSPTTTPERPTPPPDSETPTPTNPPSGGDQTTPPAPPSNSPTGNPPSPTTPTASQPPPNTGTSELPSSSSPSVSSPRPSSTSFSSSSPQTGPTTSTPRSARSTSFSELRTTFTSTLPDGKVTVVTRTSYVAVDPTPQGTDPAAASAGGLQNHAGRGADYNLLSALLASVLGGVAIIVW